MTHDVLVDASQRQAALNPQQSFIIQAPAGSGKTSLLTQRVLALLATVKQPEAILALTFTRKAAGEMRDRILDALTLANGPRPEATYLQTTWELGQAVLKRDQQQGWQLQKNPNRLRIQTIDAFCLYLTRQLPLLSDINPQIEITQQAQTYYLQAARQLLAALETDLPWQPHVKTLLRHLDNHHQHALDLLSDMLSQREQWLPYLLAAKDPAARQAWLSESLQRIVKNQLETVTHQFPEEHRTELMTLARFAGEQCRLAESDSPISLLADLTKFPGAELEDHEHWLALIELLFTKKQTWRKNLTKTCGFPTSHKPLKQQMRDLLLELAEFPRLRHELEQLQRCPPCEYNDDQWEMISALVELLPVLAAELTHLFNAEGTADFTEISGRAQIALGALDDPSELALRLDYQIQHLLVDEFQDTSIAQWQLLENLTRGWQNDDGRSLFLVGDPMQSIYRFRQAEVGLFLRAQQYGLGEMQLTPLTLHTNFRSHAGLVQWFNHTFLHVFPQQADAFLGAIPLAEATAMWPEKSDSIHTTSCVEAKQSISAITKTVLNLQQQHPTDSMVILVRTRNQLLALLPALQQADISYSAVDIDSLSQRPLIQDLWALTRALLHPADRLAWLSVLRSPFCGLSLADLHVIANPQTPTGIWQQLQGWQKLETLSADAQLRLQRIVPVLQQALQQRRRQPLAEWVANTWQQLGGPACLNDDEVQADTFFDILQQHARHHDLLDFDQFEQQLTQLFAPSPTIESRLTIMTMHKAKGLEFDHVLLPFLEASQRQHDMPLLTWLEKPNQEGHTDFILAPRRATHVSHDPIYDYIRHVHTTKSQYELGRLLYVAATRAKQSLHLFATLDIDENEDCLKSPRQGSLLAQCWSALEAQFQQHQVNSATTTHTESETNTLSLHRLAADWQHPIPITTQTSNTRDNTPELITIDNNSSRLIGTFIHRLLQYYPHSLAKENWQQQLQELGLSQEHWNEAISKAEHVLKHIETDPRAQWIFSTEHHQTHNEYALSLIENDKVKNIVIDRTFVDSDHRRWVIDYKTAQPPEGQSLPEFLSEQQRQYQQQLNHYGQALQTEQHPEIHCGLYFPLVPAWIEWIYSSARTNWPDAVWPI